MDLHNSRYGSSKLGVFSVTFLKCRHATESWESGHMQRCVILSYKRCPLMYEVLWEDDSRNTL